MPLEARWKEVLASLGYDVTNATPLIAAAAPARINLIGEHVDYMGGRVLPAALPWTCDTILLRDVGVAQGSSADLCATNVLRTVAVPAPVAAVVTANIPLDDSQQFLDYAQALPKQKALDTFVAAAVAETIRLMTSGGLSNAVMSEAELLRVLHSKTVFIEGHIPLGAGVSSSAALCVSLLYLLAGLATNGQPFSAGDKISITKAARRIENDYCGVQCGVMDQFVSVHGVENCFLEVDCDTLEYKVHSLKKILGEDLQFVLVNSMISHSLGDAYNIIRRNIEHAQAAVGTTVYGSSDFTFARFATESHPTHPLDALSICLGSGVITAEEDAMGSYVVEEMRRTESFLNLCSTTPDALADKSQVSRELGGLLTATHAGLSKKLKVSTAELDFIEEYCRTNQLTLGARLMGGGFGGCCLCLLERKNVAKLLATLPVAFQAKFGLKCDVYCIDHLGSGAQCSVLEGEIRD